MSPARILVTSALPYANGPIHLGHCAGAYLPADIYCRYQRLAGRDVLYICGSDEHGVAILMRALREEITPQAVVDRYHTMIAEAFDGFGMSFDWYGRTSSPKHHETSREWFKTLAKKGCFELKTEEQLYDPEAKVFLADRFVRGTCPKCGNPDAYGDQCENCGTALSPNELDNPKSTLTDATPELRSTTHWYLPLGREQKALSDWIATHPEWKPNVLGQIKSWFVDGLGDRAMTRDLPWGVQVPEDVAKAAGVDAEGKVLYVWFDAPIGYVSATREWAEARGEPEAWKAWWQDEGSSLIHFIGKDNIVFHTLIFPAMLMLHGDYVLPTNVPANEFLNLEGDKLSTSRGWAVWLHEYLEAFPADYLRYSLCAALPETKDSDFSWKDFQGHVNNELADTVGNLVNRCMTFAQRYSDGVVPELESPSAADQAALDALTELPQRVGACLEDFRFREALHEAMALARLGNKYFNDQEPWKTRKSDPRLCGNTIHVSLQICASLSILLDPFLPNICARMRAMLRLDNVRHSGGERQKPAASQDEAGAALGWADAGRPLLSSGAALGEPEILVAKIDDEAIQTQLDKLREAAASRANDQGQGSMSDAPYAPIADTIEFDDFAKLDLRIGHVIEAEKVKKSKKLLRCQVDLGFEQRQVLAGVAEHLSPDDLIGKRVVVVANLAPRKMLGLESQGMLLMAEDREGVLRPVTTDREAGSIVR